ncbi:MAG TPA: hypothetical protein PLX89_08585 [Verrucomicrobiota bacterium]|nr:hypothetical protein [Verrucomicrobiales bacterium]HRI13048.1 hypothetical protein [Verrucomicrobiota bacterium]
MKAWDIFSCQARIDAKPEVVVLGCRTMRPGNERGARATEVLLDDADGLELKTLCRCDLLFTVEKAKLGRRRGAVTPARQREIGRKLIQGLALAGM